MPAFLALDAGTPMLLRGPSSCTTRGGARRRQCSRTTTNRSEEKLIPDRALQFVAPSLCHALILLDDAVQILAVEPEFLVQIDGGYLLRIGRILHRGRSVR